MELNTQAKSSIISKLSATLPLLPIACGFFVYNYSELGKVALSFPRYRKKINGFQADHTNTFPVFASEFIAELLIKKNGLTMPSGRNIINPSDIVPLADLIDHLDPTALSQDLINAYASLPWKYKILIPVNSVFEQAIPPEQNSTTITSNIQIIRTEHVAEVFPTEPTDPNLRQLMRPREEFRENKFLQDLFSSINSWKGTKVVLAIEKQGFIGITRQSAALEEALGDTRAILGAAHALGLVHIVSRYSGLPAISGSARIYLSQSGTNEILKQTSVPISAYITEPFEQNNKRESHSDWPTDLKRLISLFQDNEYSRRIRLACLWLYEGLANTSPVMGFLQKVMSLEILYGVTADTQELAIGPTIRQKMSHAVATHPVERDYIEENLKKIYRIRSKIVHNGQDTLSNSDESSHLILGILCNSAIITEIDLLQRVRERRGLLFH
ncbi:hypothetical protein [Zavarzinia sp. CC-PAN008]|uniref:hypothetical protein n=1 Tax=Zavarzinia sp. CC-PAN008 TaxID=3243332 RepID=UPI003F749AC0